MAIVRWRPARDMRPWANAFENYSPISRMMEDFFGGERGGDVMYWGPNVDIVENNDNFEIHAELPGVRQEDVKLSLNNNVLTITGEKKQEVKEDRDNVLRLERSYGHFERSFSLPTTVQSDKVRANFSDGVLKITLPKAEQAKARQINIEVGK
jgi:HSP20 family protein